MIAYAKVSSDNHSVFLLNHLQEQIDDIIKMPIHLKSLSKPNNDLDGVLCALFQSWIGKPFNAVVNSREFASLKKAFDLSMSGMLWSHWQLDDEENPV
ncbi:uncharacterized protein PHALS_14753 [Plasmopara halstedii]|uniref:Uncharacterized protein n=1 Tax=Plasmopara halstedii TaxID=4781 RepID=A0A0P1ARA8_PLAHL|nr:uncharacterized protein PHALS_14753 [Plasmopara halstedii]CEG43900.1 hypothetical protein PHALS_14753 [Plasmopara halstedii]|eukprot:XP_024580269.1 hypothetical protein PHALS_14753 [Plasmopara halstedii]